MLSPERGACIRRRDFSVYWGVPLLRAVRRTRRRSTCGASAYSLQLQSSRSVFRWAEARRQQTSSPNGMSSP